MKSAIIWYFQCLLFSSKSFMLTPPFDVIHSDCIHLIASITRCWLNQKKKDLSQFNTSFQFVLEFRAMKLFLGYYLIWKLFCFSAQYFCTLDSRLIPRTWTLFSKTHAHQYTAKRTKYRWLCRGEDGKKNLFENKLNALRFITRVRCSFDCDIICVVFLPFLFSRSHIPFVGE